MLKICGVAAAIAFLGSAPALAQEAGPSLHGFADLSVKNDYITPRGLHVTSTGSTVQFLNGLVLDFPQDPAGVVTDISLVAGTWTDFNPGAAGVQTLNEFDWFVGANAKLGKSWTIGAQFVQFISAPGNFDTENNIEFSLSYADKLTPISINPYAKFFWAVSGDSTVVLGKRGDTFDIELGAVPTWDLHPYGAPVVLSAPTWVTVGPKSYWGGDQNAGVFSTGLKATLPLKTPPATGHWSVYAGYQYYYLINDQLVAAQSILNNGMDDRNLHLVQVGVGLGF
ncbi:hypothetical protein LJR225_004222 [Phenylobacterium sp. LjRoot225]|uniref:hypothetical protein n=1 Tax=Phenylobacterium sp. LjRoot225 TaxID=3342285 RepID=UPI003ECF69BC